MPKELKDVGVSHKQKRYGHDMSMIRKFSSSVGQLLPVYYDFLYPGDKVRCSTEMFSQITNIVSPAMLSLKEHVDWFFVPIEQLFHPSVDRFFKIQDLHSNMFNSSDSVDTIFPRVNMSVFYPMSVAMQSSHHLYSQMKDNETTLPYSNTVDEFGVPHVFNVARLTELLGFSDALWRLPVNDHGPATDFMTQYYFVPYYAMAYQKIFYDYYRISDRTENDANFYNCDTYYNTDFLYDDDGATESELILAKYLAFFKMRYRPFRRDYFQITKVAPLIDVGSVGMLTNGVSLSQVTNWLNPTGVQSNSVNTSNVGNNTSVSGGGNSQTSNSAAMNTARLRSMFAAEKVMEITRRAAKRYDAQVLAHFGFDVPQGVSHEVYKIGSEVSQFQVNEVVSNASTDVETDGATVNVPLGERGGKSAAYSSAGKQLKFTAPCHGILMAVYSSVPESDYRPSGLDKLLTRFEREDYFLPEYDRLGMQPLFRYESYFSLAQSPAINNQLLGWQYRYMESKLKYNVVNGAFNTRFKDWTVTRNLDDALTSPFEDNINFYCYPQMLDNILNVHFQNADDDQTTLNHCYARDPLLHWFKFNVFKTSEMSTYSLPSL